MADNIVVFGLNNNYVKTIGKMLADELEMFFADVLDLLKFDFIDLVQANNIVGKDYILKQEKYVPDGTSKVYSISAEFGIGKTFFCERLQDVLKQDNTPVSMLNIWKMEICWFFAIQSL